MMNIQETDQESGEPVSSIMADKNFDNGKEDAISSGLTSLPSKPLVLQDMPEEILEHILGFLSPYKEMDMAKLVCRQWNRVIKSVVKQIRRKFYQSLFKCEVSWTNLGREKLTGQTVKGNLGISDRFSHSAAYHDGSMYIFGGCTSTNTTFNDLWRYDLTSRQWVRPVAMGTYPSPKACATMVVYNGNLVLFGGWSHPIPYPLHQSAHYFSELHVYSPYTNRWSHVLSIGQEPEALGGHSASVAGHLMVIFGGSPRPGLGTNNLWVFNFQKASWKLQPVCRDAKPEPRYGQFQATLDDKHILVMGGCVGQNRVFNDLWLLTLHPTDPWQWTKLKIEHPELAAPQTWCHAACRVSNNIVVIARSSKARLTRNIKPRTSRRKSSKDEWSSSGNSSSDSSPVSPESVQCRTNMSINMQPHDQVYQQQQQQQQQQEQLQQQHHHQQQQHGHRSDPEEAQAAGVAKENEDKTQQQPHNSLLALQQRLHRECMNLPDPDNHHHHGNQGPDREEAEGYYHRLSSRWSQEQQTDHNRQAGGSLHHYHHHPQQQPQQHQEQQQQQPPSPQRHENNTEHQHCPVGMSHQQQNADQPQFGSLQRSTHNMPANIRPRGSGGAMPSIRPNAMCNRQRQLEALQRQEEILRSKSRAFAAARKQKPTDQALASDDVELEEENVPDFVQTRNKMDAHVLDISRVLDDGIAEWRSLSELQPQGAPTETICCSLLEGRGELLLFGGVMRNMNNPLVANTAVRKLYSLHSQE